MIEKMHAKKIAIVDDDTSILDSLSVMVDFEGFEVKAFERGSDIFSMLETRLIPDVIMLDISLAGEDGRDICKKLKQNEMAKDIPVIMMSAGREMKDEALNSGACEFIAKPFELEDVVGKIYQLTT